MRARDNSHLYANISWMMVYWCARMMFGMKWVDALALARGRHPAEIRASRHSAKSRAYWRLRAKGLSYYEARAVIDGSTPEKTRQLNIEACRRYRDKWGGWIKPGTEAYNRWLMSR